MMNLKNILSKYKKHSKKGFTLVELIVVVALLSITAGATVTVFLMVHQVTRDASEITVNQYQTTQTERFIRNEFQTASNIDVAAGADFASGGIFSSAVKEDDEYVMYDATRKTVVFVRADSSKVFRSLMTIENVTDVSITIQPLDLNDKVGKPYKLFYKITTKQYEYSGGIVLGNTCIGNAKDKSMSMALTDTRTVEWKTGSADNGTVIYFHREETRSVSTP